MRGYSGGEIVFQGGEFEAFDAEEDLCHEFDALVLGCHHRGGITRDPTA